MNVKVDPHQRDGICYHCLEMTSFVDADRHISAKLFVVRRNAARHSSHPSSVIGLLVIISAVAVVGPVGHGQDRYNWSSLVGG